MECCGLAFHPDDNLEYLTNKTNGIFEWDTDIMESIKNAKKQDNSVGVPRTPSRISRPPRFQSSPRTEVSFPVEMGDFDTNVDSIAPQDLIQRAKQYFRLGKESMMKYMSLMDNDVDFWNSIGNGKTAEFLNATRKDNGVELLDHVVSDGNTECVVRCNKMQQEMKEALDEVDELLRCFGTTDDVAKSFGLERLNDTSKSFVESLQKMIEESPPGKSINSPTIASRIGSIAGCLYVSFSSKGMDRTQAYLFLAET